MNKAIIYVAHPVSGAPVANAQRTARWVRWFVENDQDRIYIAPWVAEVMGFGDDVVLDAKFYRRILDDDADVVARCDGLIAVGGSWSPGMLQERVAARILGKAVVDLTAFLEPPLPDSQLLLELPGLWATARLEGEAVYPFGGGYVGPV